MTAPTVSPFTVFPQGPGQPIDNLTGLINRQAKGLGVVGSATVAADDYKIGVIKITTGTVTNSPSGTGTVSLYLALSEDGVTFTDGLDPNSQDGAGQANILSVTSQSLATMLIQRINTPASNTMYMFNAFSLKQKLGFYVPTFFGIYVANTSNGQLSTVAANFLAGYKVITPN